MRGSSRFLSTAIVHQVVADCNESPARRWLCPESTASQEEAYFPGVQTAEIASSRGSVSILRTTYGGLVRQIERKATQRPL